MLPIDQFTLLPDAIFFSDDQQIRLSFWPVKIADNSNDNHIHQQQLTACLRNIGTAFNIPGETVSSFQNCLMERGLTGLYELISAKAEAMTDTHTKKASGDNNHEKSNSSCFRYLKRKIKTTPPVVLITLNISIFALMAASHRMAPNSPFVWKILILLAFTVLLGLNAIRLISVRDRPSNDTGIMKKFTLSTLIQGLTRIKDHSDDKFRSLNLDVDHQTVLISTNPTDFRMALLAEGKPGTPEENEGIRAYILIDEFIIGRDHKTCDLYLTEPEIGRQHARIIRREGSFFLCDLGSRNGTCLNGRRLLKNVESLLPDQCLIKFAERQFYFQAD